MKFTTLFILFSTLSFGSAELDSFLSFKNMVGVVLNSADEPIHADQVEAEIASQLKDKIRYDFSESGYLALKESFKQTQIPEIDALQNIKLENLKPGLGAVSGLGVKAVVLSYIRRSSDGYQIYFYLVSVPSNEIIHKVEAIVDTPTALESFTVATKKGMLELLKGIPFDATIVSRDGYRVILDRGANLLRLNQQISAYTIEEIEGNLVFEETGIIQITQVEPDLSFGKVTVEKSPKVVMAGNKIRLESSNSQVVSSIQLLEESSANRGLASLPPPMMTADSASSSIETEADFNPQFEISKGKIGNVGLDLGASLVDLGTLTTYENTNRNFENSRIYPQTTLRGEIYFTSRVFFEGQYSYGLGKVNSYSGPDNIKNPKNDSFESTSSSMNSLRMLLGYRLNIFAPNPGPVIFVKSGYARQAFAFNEQVKQKQYINTSFGGLLLGGGVSFHPIEKIRSSFEVSTNIFPSVKEEKAETSSEESSGTDVINVSSWDVTLKLGYELNKEMDFTVRGYLQSYGAEFTGDDKRSLKVSSISENIKGIQAGLSYYF